MTKQEQSTLEDLVMMLLTTLLMEKVALLQKKSNGRFGPKEKTQGYIVIPKCYEWVFDLKNRYGLSLRIFCFREWNMAITNPEDIDIVFKDGEWKDEHLPDNTWAIIDCEGYGDPSAGEDSFVTFEIEDSFVTFER